LQSDAQQRQGIELRNLAESLSEEHYREGVEALERGEPEEAARFLAAAIEVAAAGATPEMFSRLGDAHLLADNLAAARAALEKAVARDPDLLDAHRLLVEVYERLGLESEAARARAVYRALLAKRGRPSAGPVVA
jgi:predicted Zn-dependent protease